MEPSESVLNISAHKYGNYHKYYDFHSTGSRSSILCNNLNLSIFNTLWKLQSQPSIFIFLDIGCNEGDLSMEVYLQIKKELPSNVTCILLGIDLDSTLIQLAKEKYIKQSINSNDDSNSINTHKNISFETLNFMNKSTADIFFKEYFDMINKQYNANINSFNVISLFSITMWIHLNYGDEGIRDCLLRSSALVHTSGSLIIEPQPWKCYKSADKRCRKLGIQRPLHFNTLTIRDDIDKAIINILLINDNTNVNIIKELSIKTYWNLGKENWGRSILIFHKNIDANQYIELLHCNSNTVTIVNETVNKVNHNNNNILDDIDNINDLKRHKKDNECS